MKFDECESTKVSSAAGLAGNQEMKMGIKCCNSSKIDNIHVPLRFFLSAVSPVLPRRFQNVPAQAYMGNYNTLTDPESRNSGFLGNHVTLCVPIEIAISCCKHKQSQNTLEQGKIIV